MLAPAKGLVNGRTVRRIEGGEVTYVHILFETHQIVFAEGMLSESFHPGATVMNAMEQETRDEILALFPELATRGYGPTAVPAVATREARLLGAVL